MEWLKSRLVDDWHRAWRWGSVRFTALLGLLIWALLQFPDLAAAALNALPAEMRGALPTSVSLGLVGITVFARLLKKKQEPDHGGPDGAE